MADKTGTFTDHETWDLTDYRVVLQFENNHGNAANKGALILRHFKVTPTRYQQRLNQIMDMPEALQHSPILIHRLQAARARNVATRAARTFRTVA